MNQAKVESSKNKLAKFKNRVESRRYGYEHRPTTEEQSRYARRLEEGFRMLTQDDHDEDR